MIKFITFRLIPIFFIVFSCYCTIAGLGVLFTSPWEAPQKFHAEKLKSDTQHKINMMKLEGKVVPDDFVYLAAGEYAYKVNRSAEKFMPKYYFLLAISLIICSSLLLISYRKHNKRIYKGPQKAGGQGSDEFII